jgi:hypothetical protein
VFALYAAGYCVGRFGVELLRDDVATHISGIRVNSFTSTFVLIGAVVYFLLAPKGREDPATLGGAPQEEQPLVREPEEEFAAIGAASGVTAAGVAGAVDDDAGDAESSQTEPETAPEPEETATEEPAAEEASAEETGVEETESAEAEEADAEQEVAGAAPGSDSREKKKRWWSRRRQ